MYVPYPHPDTYYKLKSTRTRLINSGTFSTVRTAGFETVGGVLYRMIRTVQWCSGETKKQKGSVL